MTESLKKSEIYLLAAALALLLSAVLAPPLAQPALYHQFADTRTALAIPHALDVLSNVPFALWGLVGIVMIWRLPEGALSRPQRALVALFLGGLLLTAACSLAYHWQPTDAGLAIDRYGMAFAFAGLLGLCVAGAISVRAGRCTALLVLLLGPVSVWVWSGTGNVLPWGAVQVGGMVLLLALTWVTPQPHALPVRWGWVTVIYALAKGFELADHAVFELTGQLVSGHTLKHLVASLAAWPVLTALAGLKNATQDGGRHTKGNNNAS